MSNDFELSYCCVWLLTYFLLNFDISQNAGVAREKKNHTKILWIVVNLLFSIDHDDAIHILCTI